MSDAVESIDAHEAKALLEHLLDDVAAADELALHIELGDGRPVREFLDALADFGIREHVDGFELHAELGKDVDDGRREAALRHNGRALHEEKNVVLGDILGDAVVNGRGHGKRPFAVL